MKLKTTAALSLATLLTLAACGNDNASDTSSPEATATTSQAAAPTYTPAPSPTATPLETYAVGETVHLPSADFTVTAIEQRDLVASSSPDFTPDFVAPEGKRLWYIAIEWTNNTNEAIDKECFGPYMFDLHVYDIEGVEMMEVDQPGFVDGNNCNTGLMTGETGTWLTAYYGMDADFGFAEFTDYAGDSAIVVLDPSLVLTRDQPTW